MKRLLVVSQAHNVWGGMEQWVHNFTQWLLQEAGWDVRVALPRGPRFNDPAAYVRAHPHLRAIELDVRVGTDSVRTSALAHAIERYDPDVLIPIGSGAAFPAVARAKASGSRVRFLPAIRGLLPALASNVVDWWPVVDGVVSINRLFDRYFRETLPAAELDRVHYVRHGAKPALPEHAIARTASAPLRVGYVGRVVEGQKRVSDLIAFAKATRGAALELHVYGDGPALPELRAAASWAVFHGHQSQEELYRTGYPNLDVLVLFSDNEGTPNAVCEAMQHGVVPMITRYFGEAGEGFVRHGESGFTFPVGDVDAAVNHVGRLAADRELLRAMSEAGRRSVAGDTDVRMHRDWLAIFERTLALPQKIAPVESAARGGRLERVVPSALADRLRSFTGRHFPHPDGWAEWPGSVAVSREREDAVLSALAALDRDNQRRVYTSAP